MSVEIFSESKNDKQKVRYIYEMYEGDMSTLTSDFFKNLKDNGVFLGKKSMSAYKMYLLCYNWARVKEYDESLENRRKQRELEKVRKETVSRTKITIKVRSKRKVEYEKSMLPPRKRYR